MIKLKDLLPEANDVMTKEVWIQGAPAERESLTLSGYKVIKTKILNKDYMKIWYKKK